MSASPNGRRDNRRVWYVCILILLLPHDEAQRWMAGLYVGVCSYMQCVCVCVCVNVLLRAMLNYGGGGASTASMRGHVKRTAMLPSASLAGVT